MSRQDIFIGDYSSEREYGDMSYKNLEFGENDIFLITGGAGFIGSNLCEAILNMGYQVRCLDNLSTGKQGNVDLFIDNSHYEFIKGDIRDIDTCLNACEGVTYVLNQAAWGSVPRSIDIPLFYEEVNIRGTLNMMEAARRNGVKKFVYASSSSVYGDHPRLPKKEGNEGELLSPYALTKRVCEEYGKLYYNLYGLETYGLRYFNVFGRRQNPEGAYAAVIPKFIKQLLNDEQPVIYGDGRQSRDFTYIDNVIEANLRACKASYEAAGQVFNIAYGGREYLIDIYHELTKILAKDIEPVFAPERRGDIKHSNADISKAKELLGYEAEWSFENGISEVIEWYVRNL
jgi:UDP-N-acetylglucosamine 4-epimerase